MCLCSIGHKLGLDVQVREKKAREKNWKAMGKNWRTNGGPMCDIKLRESDVDG